jgi:hypothetical protein
LYIYGDDGLQRCGFEMVPLVCTNVTVAPAATVCVDENEVTWVPAASTTMVFTWQLAEAVPSFLISVFTFTVPEVDVACGVLTKVPYHVT